MTTQEHFQTPYDAYQEGFTDHNPTARELMGLIVDSRPMLRRATQPQGYVHASMCLEMLTHVPHAEAADAMVTEAQESLELEVEGNHPEHAFLAGVTLAFMPKYRARFVERRETTVDDELALWKALLDSDAIRFDKTEHGREFYEKHIILHALTARTNIVHEHVNYQTWPTGTRQSTDAACSSMGFARPEAAMFYIQPEVLDPAQPKERQLLVRPFTRPRSVRELAFGLHREAQLSRYDEGNHLNNNQVRELGILQERHSDAGELLFDRLYYIEENNRID